MNNIERQKTLANLLLNDLKEHFDKEAILAGGAPRDWYLGHEANDFDMYINIGTEDPLNVKKRIDEHFRVETEELGDSNYLLRAEKEGNPLVSALECEIEGQVVQFLLITCSPYHYVKDHYNWNMSQIWWENNNYVTTWMFELGVEKKHAVLYGEPNWAYVDKVFNWKMFKEWSLSLGWEEFLNRDARLARIPQPVNILPDFVAEPMPVDF